MSNIKKLALAAAIDDENYLIDDDFWTSFNIGADVYDVNVYVEESDNTSTFITVYPCVPIENDNYSTDIENPILIIKIKDIDL